MSFIFYDTETTGLNTSFAQILQFAAIWTDKHLNELDRYETRCRLDAHIVPSASALRVTGMTIDRITDPALPSHYEMICQMRERLSHWCPATFVGWNTIRFDESILRQALYKCLHPPYLTNTEGNQRSDILKLAQCIEAFAPGVLNVPTDERGKPSYKLDRLAPANGFAHVNAHDAVGDVEATIHVCRLIKERAPQAWEQLLHCASKAGVVSLMEDNKIFLLRESHFGKLNEYALTRIDDEDGAGAVLAYDLSVEPSQLSVMSKEALSSRLGRSPKPVRRIRPNAAPFVTPLAEGESFGDMTPAALLARAQEIQSDRKLCERLMNLSARESFAPSEHVEEQIFAGFPSYGDKARMSRFHAADWCDRYSIVEQFEDQRYRCLGRRLIYAHCPESLPEEVRSEEAMLLARRLTGEGHDNPPWTTLSDADTEAAEMEKEGQSEHVEMLRLFREHVATLSRRHSS